MKLLIVLACTAPPKERERFSTEVATDSEPPPAETATEPEGPMDCADPALWCTDACPCDVDGDGYVSDEMGGADCDDEDAGVHPGAVELCNGVEDDCDGQVDDNDPDVVIPDGVITWQDADGDGYGNASVALLRCGPGSGWVLDATDCDDTDAAVQPLAIELCGDGIDNDCDDLWGEDDPDVDTSGIPYWPDEDDDGYGDEDVLPNYCYRPDGWVDIGGDCNDGRADVNPETPWYPDLDEDGFGDPLATPILSCKVPDPAYVRTVAGEDCDDSDASVYPGAVDDCDFVDSNCDGAVDDAAPHDWVFDSDGDGFGLAPWLGAPSCLSPDVGWVDAGVGLDCNDADPLEGGPVDWFTDLDGDGVGTDLLNHACEAPAATASADGDCDDEDPAIPGAYETCGTGDEDCDGKVGLDDHVDLTTVLEGWLDVDGDGFGNAASYVTWCQELPDGVVTNDGDCDDTDPLSMSGLAFRYDGDGDGVGAGEAVAADAVCVSPGLGYVDADLGVDCDDADAHTFPGVIEQHANGVDDDCDGVVDEGTKAKLSDVADETWSWPLDAQFGNTIGVGPDLDGDGRAEVLVGAPDNDISKGAILWAGLGGELRVWIEGTANYTFVGSTPPVVRDMDADGAMDLVVGTGDEDFGGLYSAGTARIFFGPVVDGFATRSLESSGAVVGGLDSSGNLGTSVAVGDVDDDGVSDLLLGTLTSAGAAFLFKGPQAPVSLTALATTTLTGAELLGLAVEIFGDIDGDGVAEWGAGARSESPGGAVFLFSGISAGEFVADDAVATLRSESPGDWLGESLAAVGDVTGDGLPDVGATSPLHGFNNRGRVFVFAGPLVGEVAAVDAAVQLYSLPEDTLCGWPAMGAPGDLDADGISDLALPCDSQTLYVHFGPLDGAIDVATAETTLEIDVGYYPVVQSAPVDVNNDGFGDLVAADEDGDTAYLLYGPF